VSTDREELPSDPACSVERALGVLGEHWTFLVIREAFDGKTRFSEFQQALGVSTGRLTARLKVLLDAGVIEQRPYQEPGARQRYSYHLTQSGRDLITVIGALQQWGDQYRPRPEGPSSERRSAATGERLEVAFVDPRGQSVSQDQVRFVPPST
jgi:DNA-binding HxlR family transcriptional regulator